MTTPPWNTRAWGSYTARDDDMTLSRRFHNSECPCAVLRIRDGGVEVTICTPGQSEESRRERIAAEAARLEGDAAQAAYIRTFGDDCYEPRPECVTKLFPTLSSALSYVAQEGGLSHPIDQT